MAERKPCIRCERAIDSWARICPYCNWDQAVPAPPPSATPQQYETNYVPPEEFDLKKKAGMLGIGALLLVVAFLVGMVINKDDAPKHAPETLEEQAAEHNAASAPKRADTPLIPTNERGGYGSPITSAPATTATDGVTSQYSRTDATAASAAEYEQMAKRANAEKERMATLVDPRSLTGPAYVPRPRAPASSTVDPNAPQPVRRSGIVRTRPVPQYQPLPRINAQGKARLTLIIGSDGRVRQVEVERPLQGNTAELLAAVQSWRFKPATENGQPIAAPYSVEISFDRE